MRANRPKPGLTTAGAQLPPCERQQMLLRRVAQQLLIATGEEFIPAEPDLAHAALADLSNDADSTDGHAWGQTWAGGSGDG